MIQVDNLTKRYPGVTAIDRLSFRVEKGEICGFLGANGAGKSTTMKILSGFIPATEGCATVCGFDVFNESLEVRKRIGYMPENVPLYHDMRVNEYLEFRAALKAVPRKERKDRIEMVKQQCGLSEVGRKIIGHLSKGYRQRVGLADTLIHEPELIILDEPTIGLDPNQIRQVRELIRELGKQRTILLSTHILPEVEMTCSRVIIIHRGHIVASDSVERLKKLRRGGGETVVEVRADAAAVTDRLKGLPDVDRIEVVPAADGFVRAILHPKADQDLRERAYDGVRQAGWALRELTRRSQTLEDVFVQLTTEDDE
jgi:ABC-2 type transport system ATP-binding protein